MATVITDDKHYNDIAYAIREASSGEETYKPSEMADAVREVCFYRYSDGYREGYAAGYDNGASVADGYSVGKQEAYDAFWDAYQQNGERANYAYAFAGIGWTKDTFKPKHPVALKGSAVAESMFENFNRVNSMSSNMFDFSEFNDMFDFSGCTALNSTFKNAQIKNLFVDCSSATTLSSTFSSGNGGAINYLTLRVTAATTSFSGTFSYQKQLKELRFTEDSVIAATISFSACQNLTKESITSIIGALSPDASGKTVTLYETAVINAFLTQQEEWEALVASKPNWTISLA